MVVDNEDSASKDGYALNCMGSIENAD